MVPVHDEEENLPLLHEEIENAMEGLGWTWEVLYVDDGSRDRSGAVLRELAERCGHVRVLRFDVNRGQSAALVAGFRRVRGTFVVTLDADLQNDPADIPLLFEALGDHAGVSGVRVNRRDTFARRVASRIANAVRSRIVGDGIRDVGCSLKLYRAEYLRDLPAFDGLHRFLPAFVQVQGGTFAEVPVHHRPRIHGRSKYGIAGRFRRGVADLVGVRWLQLRWVELRSAEELEIRRQVRSGGSPSGATRSWAQPAQ